MKNLKPITNHNSEWLPKCGEGFKIEYHDNDETFLEGFATTKKLDNSTDARLKFIGIRSKLHSVITMNEDSENRLREALEEIAALEDLMEKKYMRVNFHTGNVA